MVRNILFAHKQFRNKSKRFRILPGKVIKKIIIGFVFAFLIFPIVIVAWKQLLVKNIYCFESNIACREGFGDNFRAYLNNSPTESISGIKKLLRQNDLLKSYKVSYVFPSTVKVNVEFKSPVIAVKGDSNWFALLDIDGTVLELTESTNIKKLEVKGGLPNIGEKVPKNIYFGCLLYEKISKILEIESFKIEDDRINLILKNTGILYIFPLDGDSDYLTGAINLIVSRLNNPDKETTIEKSEIKEIDFRFKNPVIRKK